MVCTNRSSSLWIPTMARIHLAPPKRLHLCTVLWFLSQNLWQQIKSCQTKWNIARKSAHRESQSRLFENHFVGIWILLVIYFAIVLVIMFNFWLFKIIRRFVRVRNWLLYGTFLPRHFSNSISCSDSNSTLTNLIINFLFKNFNLKFRWGKWTNLRQTQ